MLRGSLRATDVNEHSKGTSISYPTNSKGPNLTLENVSSFMSNHRRSRQALFQTKSTDNTPFSSPQAARVYRDEGNTTAPFSTADLSASLLNTPEPSRTSSGSYSLTTPSPQTSNAIVQKLRQRGSLTDPARTRRRETFGSLPVSALPNEV